VGVWNTIFGYLAFFFLDSVFSHYFGAGAHSYMLAMILGNIVAMLMAYSLHRNVTFRSTSAGKQLMKEFGRYVLTNYITLVLSVLLLPVFVEMLGASPKLAGLFVTMICTVISYFAHLRVTFRHANR
jgi:putative flippase GtrA